MSYQQSYSRYSRVLGHINSWYSRYSLVLSFFKIWYSRYSRVVRLFRVLATTQSYQQSVLKVLASTAVSADGTPGTRYSNSSSFQCLVPQVLTTVLLGHGHFNSWYFRYSRVLSLISSRYPRYSRVLSRFSRLYSRYSPQ